MTRQADLAFVGGPVATMDPVRSVTDAVAVADGRIAALGSAAVRPLIGPATDVVPLDGRLLLPGFHDAHVHPVYGGLTRLRCDLSGAATPAEYLRRIADYSRSHTGAEWILGGGWDPAAFPGGSPTRQELDAVTGDRPTCLVNQDQHGAWVNTAALRRAGLDHHTPDPPRGRIEREPDGHPSGTLHEEATRLVDAATPTTSSREHRDALLEGQRHLHSLGVTSWHDAILGSYLGYADTLEPYLDLDARGELTGRVTGALWWDPDTGQDQLSDLLKRRDHSRGWQFRPTAVKIMQDGVCENFTAAMLTDYLGEHGRGRSRVDPADLARLVTELDARGLQVHFHAVGDRAVREALDAVSTARTTNGMNDLRHQIAHVQVVDPADLPRFRELGVAANIQACWAINDAAMTDLTVPFLGPKRAGRQYPFAALRRHGAVLAAGSDWPVSSANPLHAVHAAVNRSLDGSAEPLLPEQSLDLVDALAAATVGATWVSHLDAATGSLEQGKYADLAVLGGDPFRLPSSEIAELDVDMTLVGGRVVHERI